RKSLPLSLVNQLWNHARTTTVRTGRGCPLCEEPMVVRSSHQGQVLEICPSCRTIWFDPGTYPGNPVDLEAGFQGKPLSARARETIALARVKSIREKAELEEQRDGFVHGVLRAV